MNCILKRSDGCCYINFYFLHLLKFQVVINFPNKNIFLRFLHFQLEMEAVQDKKLLGFYPFNWNWAMALIFTCRYREVAKTPIMNYGV